MLLLLSEVEMNDLARFSLYIDFDDVILKTGARVDERLNEVYQYASGKYYEKQRDKLKNEYQDALTKIRSQEKLVKEYVHSTDKRKEILDNLYCYEMRTKAKYDSLISELEIDERYRFLNLDYLLEVLNNCENYVNEDIVEPYLDYNKIIDIRYVIDDAIDFIREMIDSPYFDVNILSHCNSDEERNCKIDFIQKHIGYIPVHLLNFHKDNFQVSNKRVINSKAKYIMDIEDLEELDDTYILIDDNKNNISEWLRYGGRGILFRRTPNPDFPYQMRDMRLESFCSCLNNDEKRYIKEKHGKI